MTWTRYDADDDDEVAGRHYYASGVADFRTWASNVLNVDDAGAEAVATAIWLRDDCPHPLNHTDVGDYLRSLPDEWLLAQIPVADDDE